jgi:hypothetical protein
VQSERRSLPDDRPVPPGPTAPPRQSTAPPRPAADDRSLRGMLGRAREAWRAAMAHPQTQAPPPPEDGP